jgi:hypothetical protein
MTTKFEYIAWLLNGGSGMIGAEHYGESVTVNFVNGDTLVLSKEGWHLENEKGDIVMEEPQEIDRF